MCVLPADGERARVWGLIDIFLRPVKILLDPPVTHSLMHASYTHSCTCVYTHTHTHTKPFIALNRASVCEVCQTAQALTRHHSSCILTTIQSNIGLRYWAGNLLYGDGCYYGNWGGVRPTNKPKNAVLSCSSPRENIKFVLVYPSLPLSFCLISPSVEDCCVPLALAHNSGACGQSWCATGAPEHTRFIPSFVRMQNLHPFFFSYPKAGCKHRCSIISTWSFASWWWNVFALNYCQKKQTV